MSVFAPWVCLRCGKVNPPDTILCDCVARERDDIELPAVVTVGKACQPLAGGLRLPTPERGPFFDCMPTTLPNFGRRCRSVAHDRAHSRLAGFFLNSTKRSLGLPAAAQRILSPINIGARGLHESPRILETGATHVLG